MTTPEERLISTADMAEILNLSPRRLQQLAAGGWIDGKAARGKWYMGATAKSYATHVRLCALRGSDPSYN